MSKSKPKVFVALDNMTKAESLFSAEAWSSVAAGLKVGPNLGFQLSEVDWKILSKNVELFIDYKFFDIPSVVEKSVMRAFDCGASFCTVHALNGPECLRRLAALEKKLNETRFFKILSVTVLTSFDQDQNSLPLSQKRPAQEVVEELAQGVFESGLTGLVSSAFEVQGLKAKNKDAFLVTPGIRFAGDAVGDQKRVTTPKEAWAMGSDYIVMGRSLISTTGDAKLFQKAAENLESEWQAAQ